MLNDKYRLGEKAKLPENRYNRPSDIDWEAVRAEFDYQKTANELAEILGISAISVYVASYSEKINVQKRKRRK